MLTLKEITKEYKVADTTVKALNGISVSFRKNEFVSILGPSGCGKTTTLNIIGGLDHYTSGDLIIAGKSTKNFSVHDWDVYRNHRIGFIFQSYNLIPHQTVLQNVELALTIGGISKEERITRAKKALDRVGLKNQYNKKPNQMSGGQCQRVAIARALVNEPDILLADEPTGALDTKTSEQIMDLISEISKDKLVIMVTHNPEIAEKYSSRIIRLLDGEIIEDTNPFSYEDEVKEIENDKKLEEASSDKKPEKAKMKFSTAFHLSMKNLLSKGKRTLMTCIAGSIGIIGVSSVLAVSSGVKGYIADMQEDMLSGNPITISESAFDLTSMMDSSSFQEKGNAIVESGFVHVDYLIETLAERFTKMENFQITNDISPEYLTYLSNIPEEYLASISFDYGLDITNNIYTSYKKSSSDTTSTTLSLSAIRTVYTEILKETKFKDYASMVTSIAQCFKENPISDSYLLSQYDLVTGRTPSSKNEVIMVLNDESKFTDLLLAQLGYYTQDEFLNIAYRAGDDSHYDASLEKDKFSYDELLNKTFTWYPNDTIFTKNENPLTNTFQPFYYSAYEGEDFTNGISLSIVGILKPKDGVKYGSLSTGIYYTKDLTRYALENNKTSKLVQYFEESNITSLTSMNYQGMDTGITYSFSYDYLDTHYEKVGYVGTPNSMSTLLGSVMGGGASSGSEIYILSLREIGGLNQANSISIYPKDFQNKTKVLKYLDRWNEDGDLEVGNTVLTKEERKKVTYTDTLSIVISMINSMINIVTIALVAFTCLSLVVSCVMIAIITYVSVVERIKEIGVIRSLGGRKKDVANLFNAETFMIGTTSGLIGVGFTYLLSLILNLIVSSLTEIKTIAALPISSAIIMLCVSIVLTVLSGLIPASGASNRDPVEALRSE